MCSYDKQNKNKAEEKSYRIWAFIFPPLTPSSPPPPPPNNM